MSDLKKPIDDENPEDLSSEEFEIKFDDNEFEKAFDSLKVVPEEIKKVDPSLRMTVPDIDGAIFDKVKEIISDDKVEENVKSATGESNVENLKQEDVEKNKKENIEEDIFSERETIIPEELPSDPYVGTIPSYPDVSAEDFAITFEPFDSIHPDVPVNRAISPPDDAPFEDTSLPPDVPVRSFDTIPPDFDYENLVAMTRLDSDLEQLKDNLPNITLNELTLSELLTIDSSFIAINRVVSLLNETGIDTEKYIELLDLFYKKNNLSNNELVVIAMRFFGKLSDSILNIYNKKDTEDFLKEDVLTCLEKLNLNDDYISGYLVSSLELSSKLVDLFMTRKDVEINDDLFSEFLSFIEE